MIIKPPLKDIAMTPVNHEQIDLNGLSAVGNKNLDLSSLDMNEVVGRPIDSDDAIAKFVSAQNEWRQNLESMRDMAQAQRDLFDAKVNQFESMLAAMDGRHKQSMNFLSSAGERYRNTASHVTSFLQRIAPSRHLATAAAAFGKTKESFQSEGRRVVSRLDSASENLMQEVRSAQTLIVDATSSTINSVKADINETKRVLAEMKVEVIDDVTRARIIAGNTIAVASSAMGAMGRLASKVINRALAFANARSEKAEIAIKEITTERDMSRFRTLLNDISGGWAPVSDVSKLERLCRISPAFHEKRYDLRTAPGDTYKTGNLLDMLYTRHINVDLNSVIQVAGLEAFEALRQCLVAAGVRPSPEFVKENADKMNSLHEKIDQLNEYAACNKGFRSANIQTQSPQG